MQTFSTMFTVRDKVQEGSTLIFSRYPNFLITQCMVGAKNRLDSSSVVLSQYRRCPITENRQTNGHSIYRASISSRGKNR